MDDRSLIKLYISGDESAVAETAKVYGAYCFSVAFRILGNESDAEECVSDTWLRAWESVPKARPESLKYYLAKITRNLAINRLTEQSAASRGGEYERVCSELLECLPDRADAGSEVEAAELEKTVNEFVLSLKEMEANIFVRRCFYMESVKDIAQRYGLSANHAAAILSRTRKKLKKHLIKEGYLYE